MDYEKKYKEALERAKVIYQGSYKPDTAATIAETLQNVFPELRESEDERIRKAIHIYLDWLDGHKDYQPKGDYTIKDMIAWLEKQGEQKPAEWSKEDVDIIDGIIMDYKGEIEHLSNSTIDEQAKPIYQKRIDFLNRLKSLYLVKQEWSEEDGGYNPYKATVESITEMCKRYDVASHSGLRDFYDNVKVKCKEAIEYDKEHPQKQWKPSKEQISALDFAIDCTVYPEFQNKSKVLIELLEQLKQL